MQIRILALPFAFALLSAIATESPAAAVNCASVNRDLKLGKWPADIAESMGITLADVKYCEDSARGSTTADAADPSRHGAAPKGATPPAEHKAATW